MITDEGLDRTVLNETADGLSGNTPLMFAAIENKISFMMSSNCRVQQNFIFNQDVQIVFYVLYTIIAIVGIIGNILMIISTVR